MFAVQRYDASGTGNKGEGSSNGAGRVDRITLINQRKAALHINNASIHDPTSTLPSVSAVASTSTKVVAPAPAIHPSRLAISHTLRQADQKAKAVASGISKEKTKAKQRYLKTKKERRKKRKAVESKRSKKSDQSHLKEQIDLLSAEDSDSDESDSEVEEENGRTEDTIPPGKKRKTVGEKNANSVGIAVNRDQSRLSTSDSGISSLLSGSASVRDSPSMEQSEEDQTVKKQEERIEGDQTEEIQKEQIDLNQTEEMQEEQSKGVEGENAVRIPEDSEASALSRFPAPKRTLQASRRDLAAQGLPHGLAHPQRIDPALSQKVKANDQPSFLDQISPTMKAKLSKMGITSWFAVQIAVIPLLLSKPQSRTLYPNPPLADLCVSAPTGSGKTLSYTVPIVEVLSNRFCRQLRALIILPTRDLVNQVKETMLQVAKGTSLSIAAITGQQGFAQEQRLLMEYHEQTQVAGSMAEENANKEEEDNKGQRRSKIDILIATPGRLIDHLNQTPSFTLQHLRFLVIDEADRLLGQSFQEWLPRVLDSLDPAKDPKMEYSPKSYNQGLAPAWLQYQKRKLVTNDKTRTVLMQDGEIVGVQKLLFSATLTRDPAKILALQLRNAAFISVEEEQSMDDVQSGAASNSFIDRQESFALPASLTEHMIVTKGDDKPLDLLYLLHGQEYHLRQVLCFTKSVENAARLVKLIDFFSETTNEDQIVVKEYSSDLNGMQRSRILQDFKEKKIDVLVCSDVIARGIDLPDVRHVISYDAPIDMAKYVHRVGRTARANRQGDAWTLVEEQEARHFKTMMKRGGRRAKINKVKIRSSQRETLQKRYEEALLKLESLYSR